MGTSTTTSRMSPRSTLAEGSVARATCEDRLAELDSLVARIANKDRESAERTADFLEAQEKFVAAFHNVCEREVRPAMQAVLERLQHAGGGGVIEEHSGGEPRFPEPGLTLWMSLKGGIAGGPRPDRHPYLQLAADFATRTGPGLRGRHVARRRGGSKRSCWCVATR